MLEVNRIYNIDCREGFKKLPDNSIDLILTSPPYNIGIEYDSWDDNMEYNKYYDFINEFLKESYRVLKEDGRIVLNILYECKMNNIRMFNVHNYWKLMEKIGFKWSGLVDLQEIQPHKPKLTAWGSWMNSSSPFIYNPKECLILACKKTWKKQNKKNSYFKKNTSEIDKKKFISLVSGVWKYRPDTRPLTKATFSKDIPINAIKLLCQEGDIILDPFCGSGTICVTSIKLKNLIRTSFIGFEISKDYFNISKKRINKTIPINSNKFI
jgi:site-specific DNA-methyltransferase (adenine-specific)